MCLLSAFLGHDSLRTERGRRRRTPLLPVCGRRRRLVCEDPDHKKGGERERNDGYGKAEAGKSVSFFFSSFASNFIGKPTEDRQARPPPPLFI